MTLSTVLAAAGAGLPPGAIVAIVMDIVVPLSVIVGVVEWRARHGSWPWKHGPKD